MDRLMTTGGKPVVGSNGGVSGSLPPTNVVPLRKPKPKEAGTYECTRCKSPAFLLSELGTVWCAKCGALTKNLLVVPAGSDR
jgi:DNA-directed RNA polymerase subunit RPC12/RpoP